MTIARIDDHALSGLELLLEQYKRKPRIAALIASELTQIQALEDAAWDVLIKRLIDYAVDEQLVVLGRIVGQDPIEGENDELFRLRIRTRIRANRSLGTSNDVIAVALLALEGFATEWTYEERYPASFIVDIIDTVSAQTAQLTAEFLRLAKAPGVGFSVHYSDVADAETFAFAEGDTWEDDVVRGMSGDDIEGPGGVWIGTE